MPHIIISELPPKDTRTFPKRANKIVRIKHSFFHVGDVVLIRRVNTEIHIQHDLVIKDRTFLYVERIKLKYFTSTVTFKRIVL